MRYKNSIDIPPLHISTRKGICRLLVTCIPEQLVQRYPEYPIIMTRGKKFHE
jgi:hypothetical protein